MKALDLTGQRYNHLVVIEFVGSRNGFREWRCLCDCGNICVVRANDLRNGHTKSCGCAHKNMKDKVEYVYLHKWVAKNKKKTGKCLHCGKEGFTQWANVSGDYKKDIDDFIELCQSCHFKYDFHGLPKALEHKELS